jgi:multiple sugar transport system substrate-binding protein
MMPWYYPEIKSAGRQLALNDLIDADAWDVCQMWLVFKDPADDKIYGVNQEVSNTALWYDRAVLAELGLEEPSNPDWTWDEFIDFALMATVDSNGRNAKDSQFSPDDVKVFGTNLVWNRATCWGWIEWLWQAGGDFYNEDETQVTFDSPEGIEACGLYVDLIHKYHAMALPGSLAGGLGTGFLATTQTGNWSYGSLVRSQGLDVGAIDLPQYRTKASLILPGYWHLLNNGADKVKGAWEWLKYRTNVANVLMFSEGAGYLPIRRDVVAGNAYQMFMDNQAPQLRVHTDLLAIGRVQPTTHLFRPQLMQIHGEWFERAVLGDATAEEAMTSAAAEINSQPELFEQDTVQGPAC